MVGPPALDNMYAFQADTLFPALSTSTINNAFFAPSLKQRATQILA